MYAREKETLRHFSPNVPGTRRAPRADSLSRDYSRGGMESEMDRKRREQPATPDRP